MSTKRPCDKVSDSDNQTAGPSHRPKRHHCYNRHNEKFDAMFELLGKINECSEQMQLHAIENKKEVFDQVEKAIESYNLLSEQILHAIVNIGGTNEE